MCLLLIGYCSGLVQNNLLMHYICHSFSPFIFSFFTFVTLVFHQFSPITGQYFYHWYIQRRRFLEHFWAFRRVHRTQKQWKHWPFQRFRCTPPGLRAGRLGLGLWCRPFWIQISGGKFGKSKAKNPDTNSFKIDIPISLIIDGYKSNYKCKLH